MSGAVGGAFRSFAHRNYRLYFFGQLVSFVGTWTQMTAQRWLVFRLSRSVFLLGLIAFADQIPIFLLGLFGGMIADRFKRRDVLLITQSLAAFQAFLLAFLAFSGTVRIWQIFALASFLGAITAFDMPTTQAFVVEMVGPADLGNAIALNSSLGNLARTIGPAIAGLMLAAYGEWSCFLLNGASFLAVLVALAMMRLEPRGVPRRQTSYARFLGEGLSYVRARPVMVAVLALFGLACMAPFSTLMPAFAEDILGVGARGLGLMMAASGLGAAAGAVMLAARRSDSGLSREIALGVIVYGLSIVIFANSQNFPLSLAACAGAGWGLLWAYACSNTLLQTLTPDILRGRVMSLFAITFMGTSPLGSLLAGFGAQRFGAPATVGLGGLLCLAAAAVYLAVPVARTEATPEIALLTASEATPSES